MGGGGWVGGGGNGGGWWVEGVRGSAVCISRILR